MHKACKYPCLISEGCNTSIWFLILLQWIWDTQNINNLQLDSCSLTSFVKIGLCFIHRVFSSFCDFTWLPLESPFSSLPLKNLDEIQWCFELLHRDGLHHHVRRIILCIDLHQVDHLVIYVPLTYLMIPHINVFYLFEIPVIFRKMNSTLTVAMKPNWILYDTKSLNQSS